MSFNYENIGNPIAKIIGKTNNKTIYLNENSDDIDKPFKELQLSNNNMFQQIPNNNRERDILYISGQSGSGKSYYSKNYIKEYKKIHKNNDIYLFSNIMNDDSFDEIKNIKKIDIFDDDFIDIELKADEFGDSLLLFDDVDCIQKKQIKKKIYALLNEVLMVGRHYNISIIFTSHIICNGLETKGILNEAHSITIFPNNMGNRSLKYVLDSYLGLDKKQIEKIKNFDSRWVTINRSYPQSLLTEKFITLTKNL